MSVPNTTESTPDLHNPSVVQKKAALEKPLGSALLDHSKLLSKQHSDGGWGLVPIQSRAERFSSFDVADFEAVTGFEAEWKYTPIKIISDLLDGCLDGSRYDFESSIDGKATLDWVERTHEQVGKAGIPEERGSANAWSAFEEGLLVTISDAESASVRIERRAVGTSLRAAHTMIEAKPGSRGVVVIQNTGDARLSENLEILVGDGARLTVVTVQEWTSDSIHLASHFARLGRDAHLKHVMVSLSGHVVRVNTSAHLLGEGSDVELYGVYFADSGQHLEQQVFVNHDAPNTKSRVSYRGALQGEQARTVWIGDVLIRQTAPGTDSYEENRNLLLSNGARADSVPNLEIETGDIFGAGHASASGRFDDEQLFYLQARGIPEADARRLVVRGFLSGIVQKIGIPELENRLEAAIETELGGAES